MQDNTETNLQLQFCGSAYHTYFELLSQQLPLRYGSYTHTKPRLLESNPLIFYFSVDAYS